MQLGVIGRAYVQQADRALGSLLERGVASLRATGRSVQSQARPHNAPTPGLLPPLLLPRLLGTWALLLHLMRSPCFARAARCSGVAGPFCDSPLPPFRKSSL